MAAGLMHPKETRKKKRKKHAQSIMQEKSEKRCYLCMLLEGDYRIKEVQEHHVCFGTANRAKSEAMGLKVNLCIERHHETGPQAAHRNAEMARILQREAQKAYEETHTRDEWMAEIGRNYLGNSF